MTTKMRTRYEYAYGPKRRIKHRKKRYKRKKSALGKWFILIVIILITLAGVGHYRDSKVEEGLPQSLKELKEKYPETEKFVLDYPKNKDKDYNIDLTKEVQKGKIPLFLQWDKRWGYGKYGNDFHAVTGCGPTCLSMIVCGLTGESKWNPKEVAHFSEEQGCYVPGQGTSWSLMTEGAQSLGITAENGRLDGDYIRDSLAEGKPIICSMYPGDFTYTGHFIVLAGIDSDGKIIVNDPNSKKNSKKHWDVEELLPQIKNLWRYEI